MLFHFVGLHRVSILNGDSSLAHLALRITNVGWIGVDVFFAISGFVVALSISDSVKAKNDIWTFYKRRAARLLPAYYLALAVLVTVVIISGLPSNDLIFAQPILWLHLANFAAPFGLNLHSDFFSAVHLWSLSVEMQFYLLLPALMLLCPSRHLLAALTSLVLFSVAARLGGLWLGIHYNTIYSVLPFRLDGFAFGALLAVLHHRDHINRTAENFIWVASAVLGVGMIVYLLANAGWHKSDPLVQSLGYTAIGLSGAGVSLSLYRRSAPERLLALMSTPLLVSLGKISYSLYLWHFIFAPSVSYFAIILCDRVGLVGFTIPFSVVINLTVSLALAAVSYPAERFGQNRKPVYRSSQEPHATGTENL